MTKVIIFKLYQINQMKNSNFNIFRTFKRCLWMSPINKLIMDSLMDKRIIATSKTKMMINFNKRQKIKLFFRNKSKLKSKLMLKLPLNQT